MIAPELKPKLFYFRIIKDIETHMRDRARLAKELEVALEDLCSGH